MKDSKLTDCILMCQRSIMNNFTYIVYMTKYNRVQCHCHKESNNCILRPNLGIWYHNTVLGSSRATACDYGQQLVITKHKVDSKIVMNCQTCLYLLPFEWKLFVATYCSQCLNTTQVYKKKSQMEHLIQFQY